MKALVTGASGFVGKYLTDYLLQKGLDVIGIDKELLKEKQYQQLCIDVNDINKLKDLIAELQPEYIYHLAAPAFIPDSFSNPKGTFETIIFGTVNILEIMREVSPHSKLLYIGSSDEYGINEGNIIFKEDVLPTPYTPYAAAKLSASLICQQYAKLYGINVVRTRSFNHCGPGQSERFVSASIAKQIAILEKTGELELNLGDITTSRDFLDVRDVIEAYYLIMNESDNAGELYNVCSGKPTPIKEMLDIYLAEAKVPRDDIIINSSKGNRKVDSPITIGDNSKIKKLGWKQNYDIHDTFKETLSYWRKKV